MLIKIVLVPTRNGFVLYSTNKELLPIFMNNPEELKDYLKNRLKSPTTVEVYDNNNKLRSIYYL